MGSSSPSNEKKGQNAVAEFLKNNLKSIIFMSLSPNVKSFVII